MQRSRKNDSPAIAFRSRSHCSRSRRISPSVVFGLVQVGTAQPNNKTRQRPIASLHNIIPVAPLIAPRRRQPAKQIAAPSVHNSSHQFRSLIFSPILGRFKIFPTIPSLHNAVAQACRYDQSEFCLKLYEHSNFLVNVRATLPSAQEAL